jgi:5'(3')-deoxyribonucleotidase
LQIPNNNIGVDLDGVIADIVTQLVHFSRIRYGLRLTPSQFSSENIETCTAINAGQLNALFCEPTFFRTMRAVQGARRSLAQLSAAGYVIHVITDRFWYPGIQDDTRKWVTSRLLRIGSLNFARKAEKPSVAGRLGVRWFIEDQRSNANLLSQVCRVLLIDQPYNQGLLAANVLRVKSFQDAVNVVVNDLQAGPFPNGDCLQPVG